MISDRSILIDRMYSILIDRMKIYIRQGPGSWSATEKDLGAD